MCSYYDASGAGGVMNVAVMVLTQLAVHGITCIPCQVYILWVLRVSPCDVGIVRALVRGVCLRSILSSISCSSWAPACIGLHS